MAGSGGPQPKKVKIEDFNKSVFHESWEDSEALEQLKIALERLDSLDYSFCLLKILKCNADKGYSFSQAYCETLRGNFEKNKRGTRYIEAYPFSTIFEHGFSLIKDYIADKNDIPVKRGDRIALERLLSLLTNLKDVEESLNKVKSKSDVEWAIALAHHLLSKLAVSQTYIVDKYPGSPQEKHCSCCDKAITGQFGDTSIGSTAVWHGYLDLIFGSEVPVSVAEDIDGNTSSFERKKSPDFPAKYKSQLIAQTIVFSFLQKKENPAYENFLIPTIGIAKDYAVVFAYDCEHDIFLEGSVIKIRFSNGELVTSSVLAIWLALNFSLTCSGVTEEMKNFTADFPEQVGKELETYQNCLCYGCGSGTAVEDMYEPERFQKYKLLYR